MILSTHAIVGGAIASLIPTHPIMAVVAGFASHFAIDAIPHWDYQLRSIAVGKGADNRGLRLSRGVLIDLTKIGLDACAGLVLALWLFATPASMLVVVLGAIAAMVPDPLQFVHSLYLTVALYAAAHEPPRNVDFSELRIRYAGRKAFVIR